MVWTDRLPVQIRSFLLTKIILHLNWHVICFLWYSIKRKKNSYFSWAPQKSSGRPLNSAGLWKSSKFGSIWNWGAGQISLLNSHLSVLRLKLNYVLRFDRGYFWTMRSTHVMSSDVSLNVLEPPIIIVWPAIEIADAECLGTINGANRDHKLFRYSATTGVVIISFQKFQ